jgi:hypothetical protein
MDRESAPLWSDIAVSPTRIIYCHCAYAQVVPAEVKQEVLRRLAESGAAFDAVADLCEMSARRDPGLKALAAEGGVKIAACYPRAVRGLFIAADAPLPAAGVEICNMRTDTAEQVVNALLTVGGRPVESSANSEPVLEERK